MNFWWQILAKKWNFLRYPEKNWFSKPKNEIFRHEKSNFFRFWAQKNEISIKIENLLKNFNFFNWKLKKCIFLARNPIFLGGYPHFLGGTPPIGGGTPPIGGPNPHSGGKFPAGGEKTAPDPFRESDIFGHFFDSWGIGGISASIFGPGGQKIAFPGVKKPPTGAICRCGGIRTPIGGGYPPRNGVGPPKKSIFSIFWGSECKKIASDWPTGAICRCGAIFRVFRSKNWKYCRFFGDFQFGPYRNQGSPLGFFWAQLKNPRKTGNISKKCPGTPWKNGFGERAREKRGYFRYLEGENWKNPLASYSGAYG